MHSLNKQQIAHNFDIAAKSYNENSRLQRRVAKELMSYTKSFDGKILDIGCGTGYFADQTDWDITGLDISPAMVELNENAVVGDAENIPFDDESFDNAISSLTMQWAESYDKFAQEAYRVLKPNGKVAVSVFAPGTLQELINSFSYIDKDQHILKFPSSMLLFAVFKKAGFQKLNIQAQKITYLYDDIFDLLKSMKNIGASYPFSGSKKGLKGKSYFEKLENIYRNTYETEGKLPATWQAIYIIGEK